MAALLRLIDAREFSVPCPCLIRDRSGDRLVSLEIVLLVLVDLKSLSASLGSELAGFPDGGKDGLIEITGSISNQGRLSDNSTRNQSLMI
jgi:hypothetical protein